MGAPAAVARLDPPGIKMPDGFRALVTFEADPDINLWEIQITPVGVEGGDPIPQTTMHNDVWHTQKPKSLKALTSSTFTCAYDPGVTAQIIDIVNKETVITDRFYDGSTIAYYGYLRSFIPGPLVEGQRPEATVTIEFTNLDDSIEVQTEEGPVIVSVAGS